MKALPLVFLIVLLCGATDTFREAPSPEFTHRLTVGDIGDWECMREPTVTEQSGLVHVSLITPEGGLVEIWSVDTVIVEQVMPEVDE